MRFGVEADDQIKYLNIIFGNFDKEAIFVNMK